MARAEFEEKEYEMCVAPELAERNGGAGSACLFPAGQVLEHTLGYDTAADPVARNRIWRALGVWRPTGVQLLPALWPASRRPLAAELPGHVVSLILQYKRPEYLRGPRAAQWRFWRQPYFRFRRDADQHRVLRRLETKLSDEVVVRYAAPAFWQRAELEQRHWTRSVLESSGFVSPNALGAHHVWTYVAPGVNGRANPASRTIPFDTVERLLAKVRELVPPAPVLEPSVATDVVVTTQSFRAHVARLAATVNERSPSLRRLIGPWELALREALPDLPEEDVVLIREFGTAATVFVALGASWHVALEASGAPP